MHNSILIRTIYTERYTNNLNLTMKKILVTTIADDMIVARDICNTSGNILVAKGTKLSSALGRRLENWGIATVYIEGEEEVQKESNIVQESPENIQKHLLQKFSQVLDNPLMKTVFNAVYEFRLNNHIN